MNEVNSKSLPSVRAVVPARDECETIAETVRSLLDQDYRGDFSIIVVDDNSSDGTAEAAMSAAKNDDEHDRLRIIDGAPLPAGWVGKMWAVSQGIEAASLADYILLTDADIAHDASGLSSLVAKAEAEGLGLTSLMVKLRCQSFWEKLLIPAFIYFFQKLYPFPDVNDSAKNIAAAAGGCMLVHAETLKRAGGIEQIRNKIIDDCALARLIKPLKPIWLGLSEDTRSLRAYDDLAEIWRMVARTAYVQLDHKIILLIGTVLGMAFIYALPPIAFFYGLVSEAWMVTFLGGAAWLVMTWTYLPTLNLYGLNVLWALMLPVAGIFYLFMTIDSARRHYAGAGGAWKGRTYGA